MASSITKSFVAPPPLSTRIEKEAEFFSKPFLMSYSGLNRLLYSAALFYQHYVLNQRDDTMDQNMIEGSLIHCLLLDPDNFDNQFVISVDNVPSDNPKKILHSLYDMYKELKKEGDDREELHKFSFEIIDLLAKANLYQSLKTDGQRLDKMLEHVAYWEYLKRAEGRIVVDPPTYEFARSVVDKVKSNARVMEVMGFFSDSFNGITKMNEVQLTMFDEERWSFGLRGFLDNLVFDPHNKVIRVNDVKKTGKDLSSFKESIEYFRYWIQAAMYYMMVESTYLSRPEYADWKIEFRFIVIDPYMQISPVAISPETMATWIEQTKAKLDEAEYHFKRQDFSLPYEFLVNNEVVL